MVDLSASGQPHENDGVLPFVFDLTARPDAADHGEQQHLAQQRMNGRLSPATVIGRLVGNSHVHILVSSARNRRKNRLAVPV